MIKKLVAERKQQNEAKKKGLTPLVNELRIQLAKLRQLEIQISAGTRYGFYILQHGERNLLVGRDTDLFWCDGVAFTNYEQFEKALILKIAQMLEPM